MTIDRVALRAERAAFVPSAGRLLGAAMTHVHSVFAAGVGPVMFGMLMGRSALPSEEQDLAFFFARMRYHQEQAAKQIERSLAETQELLRKTT